MLTFYSDSRVATWRTWLDRQQRMKDRELISLVSLIPEVIPLKLFLINPGFRNPSRVQKQQSCVYLRKELAACLKITLKGFRSKPLLPLYSLGSENLQFTGAFHYTKNYRHFSWQSNGEVRFGSVQPECSGRPLKVVHFDRSDRNLLFHLINRFVALLLFGRFLLVQGIGSVKE